MGGWATWFLQKKHFSGCRRCWRWVMQTGVELLFGLGYGIGPNPFLPILSGSVWAAVDFIPTIRFRYFLTTSHGTAQRPENLDHY